MLLIFATLLLAHQQPTTLVVLDLQSGHVAMSLHFPLNELELAFGHDVTRQPEKTMAGWRPSFRKYLLQHIHPATNSGQPWSVDVLDMTIGDAEQTQFGPFQEVFVKLKLTPPLGAGLRDFILTYDVILHQVVTHRALVSIRGDWESGQVQPAQVGVIAVNTGTTSIDPLPVHFHTGSSWTGFQAMVSLGVEHIREGTDHLLFLLVLLLPATLTVAGRHWGAFRGSQSSLVRLAKIVTAFTLGHSVTLLAGALHWLTLPPQPVEVLIAFSILVTAVHAIRPIFPGREARIAAGFGLVHGLAFATVLADLNLPPAALALSILGFNLGIELMQFFVIVITIPWLILLSLTPAYAGVRVGGALAAAIASVGWIVNRVSGRPNEIERLMTRVSELAPLGIVFLALIAISASLYTTLARPAGYLTESETNQ